jgi:hypothetical protein
LPKKKPPAIDCSASWQLQDVRRFYQSGSKLNTAMRGSSLVFPFDTLPFGSLRSLRARRSLEFDRLTAGRTGVFCA